mmetsp:Transcript_36721/g.58870  ORF Transcript_36721/g.58870 Transcript_36721/m.58870 type:complete len:266 (+) Transcript_36721:417-1214(+)
MLTSGPPMNSFERLVYSTVLEMAKADKETRGGSRGWLFSVERMLGSKRCSYDSHNDRITKEHSDLILGWIKGFYLFECSKKLSASELYHWLFWRIAIKARSHAENEEEERRMSCLTSEGRTALEKVKTLKSAWAMFKPDKGKIALVKEAKEGVDESTLLVRNKEVWDSVKDHLPEKDGVYAVVQLARRGETTMVMIDWSPNCMKLRSKVIYGGFISTFKKACELASPSSLASAPLARPTPLITWIIIWKKIYCSINKELIDTIRE